MSLAERLGRESEALTEPLSALKAGVRAAVIASAKASDTEGLSDAIDAALTTGEVALTTSERHQLQQVLMRDISGFGPLEPLLQDTAVTEIMVVSFDEIYVETAGMLHKTDAKFESEMQLRNAVNRMIAHIGRRVDLSSPMVDARLPDGSRINVVLPPVAVDGATVTIRKFATVALSMDDLVNGGTLPAGVAEYLTHAVSGHRNIVVSGGTGSGKTTTLNVLGGLIPASERVITIEDSAELRLDHAHLVRLETRPANTDGAGAVTIRDLVRNALRMRPDRVIVGEVRDGAAFDMLQALNTGHSGSLTTVHANSASDALARLQMMCLMANLELPAAVAEDQVWRAVDVVVHQVREADGHRKIDSIVELEGRQLKTVFDRADSQIQKQRHPATGLICLRDS
ncbi:MAG: hypothetical protein RJA35_1276 [Actinomycetota bacterium]|jgi:pilus assembly protein CpaF